MLRYETCLAKVCAEEILAYGQVNMKMYYIFTWLTEHEHLAKGTEAVVIKLYEGEVLVAYSLFESYEKRKDKIINYQGETYQDLGVIHFVTFPEYRKKGYASLLADKLVDEIIQPLLARHSHCRAYVTATGRAVPLIQRTNLDKKHLVTQFYSDLTFTDKVVKQVTPYILK